MFIVYICKILNVCCLRAVILVQLVPKLIFPVAGPPAAEQICITDRSAADLSINTENKLCSNYSLCFDFSGASAHKPCIFPFKFNGVVYNQCTWVSAHLTEHKVVELETKFREVSIIMVQAPNDCESFASFPAL